MRAITRQATFASIGLALAALLATGLGASHATAILPLRALGHALPWSGNVALAPVFPGVGSLSSFAVGDDTITLSGAADTTRRTDAVPTVVARS